jgi:hypothetical protein
MYYHYLGTGSFTRVINAKKQDRRPSKRDKVAYEHWHHRKKTKLDNEQLQVQNMELASRLEGMNAVLARIKEQGEELLFSVDESGNIIAHNE